MSEYEVDDYRKMANAIRQAAATLNRLAADASKEGISLTFLVAEQTSPTGAAVSVIQPVIMLPL